LKANVSLSLFSWKAVLPQLRTCSCKTTVSTVAVGSSHNICPWCDRTPLTTTFVEDQLSTNLRKTNIYRNYREPGLQNPISFLGQLSKVPT